MKVKKDNFKLFENLIDNEFVKLLPNDVKLLLLGFMK